jgi:catechol 2,3-dioxygenase-like lactoylglutathione lyase family enzyme
MSLLGGVHHVSLNVDDAEVAGRFYEDVLGLTRIERPDFGFPGVWLSAGAVQVHLIEVIGHAAPEGQHFAFRVDDVDAVQARLVELGVDASTPFSTPGAGRQSFLHDPAGNLIELNQPESPA